MSRADQGLIAVIVFALLVIGSLAGLTAAVFSQRVKCTFDRNEIGPIGDHGQWYWDVFKCGDGSERRTLVAGPRG